MIITSQERKAGMAHKAKRIRKYMQHLAGNRKNGRWNRHRAMALLRLCAVPFYRCRIEHKGASIEFWTDVHTLSLLREDYGQNLFVLTKDHDIKSCNGAHDSIRAIPMSHILDFLTKNGRI